MTNLPPSALKAAAKHWIRDYGFSNQVSSRSEPDGFVIEFETNTTKTRASSMVTRISLILSDLADRHRFQVVKHLLGEEPKRRDEISLWKISVNIPRSRRAAAGA